MGRIGKDKRLVTEIKMASKASVFTKICLFCSLFSLCEFQIPDSTVAIQNQNGLCSSIWDPVTRNLKERDYYDVISHTNDQAFYESDRNCVVTLIGKTGYQWEIKITRFDVEAVTGPGGNVVRCPDFLKIYDAERCDNAKLLKGINFKTGLCGTLDESSVGNLLFTSCSNKLTVQFKTDTRQSFHRGFAMNMRQYPWRNPTGGPDCDPDLNGLAVGVWRDGTFGEFQHTWNEQPVIPGYVPGGSESDYDKEVGGVQCYECMNCPVEPFDPEKDGTAIKSNCYTCSKEWDEEYQAARRKCYSRTEYLNFILSIKEIESPFFGCRTIATEYGRTVNYCFCDTDTCNTGTTANVNHIELFLSLIVTAVFRVLV